MRDTDQDLTSVVLVRRGGPTCLADLQGCRVGVGAADSPQATLIPLEELAAQGIDVEVVRHDVLVGKHGDHVGGERDAVKALLAGTVDAACILDANRLAFSREGTVPPGAFIVLHTTERYDHCNFTVVHPAPVAQLARFTNLLLGMSYADPVVRPLLDLEGLTAWRPGRTSGYAPLERAVARTGYLDGFIARHLALRPGSAE
jgi:ABC-type phosphate/phosphonate transport system substrate-binding protein